MTGFTDSTDFPTVNPLQATLGGGPYYDAFVAKISTASAGPVVSLSALSLTFGSQTVGMASTAQAVTLTNTGNAALSISQIAPSGDFGETDTCPASLAANANCTINVTFTPTVTGTRNGTITITDNNNGVAGSTQTVSLTGAGVGAAIAISSVSPTSVTLVQGASSQSVTVNLTETNYTGSVTLATSTLPSGVTATITQPGTGNSGSISLLAASTATLITNQTITITASGTGVSSVTSNFTLSVTASGGGGATTISPLPTSLFFATATATGSDRPATTTSLTLTIKNTGNAQLTFTSIPLPVSQSGPSDFTSAGTCSTSTPVASGASCTVVLVFAPTQAGERDGTLTLSDNAQGSPQQVMLKGFGMHGYAQDAADVPATYDGTQDCVTADEGCALSSASSIMTTFNPEANATKLNTYLTNNNGYCTESANVECNINWTAVPGYMSTLVNPTSIYLLPWCNVDINKNIVQTKSCPAESLYSYLEDQIVTNQNRVVLGLSYTSTVGKSGTHFIAVTAPNGPNDWYVLDPSFGKGSDPNALNSLQNHINGFQYTSPSTGQTATVTFTVTGVGVYAPGVMPSYDVHACSPVELLITDPQGRQLGNGGSGSDVFDIPDASYSRGFPLADDSGGGPPVGDPAGTKLVHILSPAAGTYSLVATGTASGTYALTVQSTATDGTIQQTTETGTTSPGAVAPYQITYDPTPGKVPTVTALPNAALSTNSANLGGQLVDSTSAAQIVTLSNTGNAPLSVSGITGSGDFSQTNNCGSTVGAGSNCSISVTFKPTSAGTRTGTLTISDNSFGGPQSVALSGTGQDFTLISASGSSTTAKVAPGAPATYTLSAAGLGGFNQNVTFTCTGAPSEATCTVSPNPATAGSTATNVTVTVTTTSGSSSAPRFRLLPPAPPQTPVVRGLWMLSLALIVIVWAFLRRKQQGLRQWQSTIPLIAAGLLLVLALGSCGGGGGSGGGGPAPNPGTPAGTYTLTVTGTAGSGASALSHSVTLTLNVS